MKRTRSIIALILTAVFAFGALSACNTEGTEADATTEATEADATDATEADATEGDATEATEATTEGAIVGNANAAEVSREETLIYGSTTQVNNDFYTGWTNLAVNAYIKELIHGGNDTYTLDHSGQYVLNPVVVSNLTDTDNEDGSKTFTFELTDNRVWSDGTPITAKDYVFNALLSSHPHFAALDASAVGGYYNVGYEEYNMGETNVFAGVRLLGEQSFSVTVKAELLPQYYDYIMAAWSPAPMHILAPGCTLADDGEGAYLSEEFTAELLEETMMDPATGYRYNPTVSSGPYTFVSYNPNDYTAIIDLNPNFLTTYDGVKPSIKRIIFKFQVQATQMQELAAGDVDMVSGIGDAIAIEEGLALLEEEAISSGTYNRSGYGMIRFHCDQSPTQFASVRQAIAYLLDREEFNRQYAQGYAVTVDSEFSLASYIYQENKDYLEENLIHYTLDPERAVEILEADGWMMGDDGIRHKEVEGVDMPLVIEWMSSTGNVVSDLLRSMLLPEAEKIGMKINETAVTNVLDAASRNGIRDEDAQYFMFNMAIGFGIPDIPYDRYSDRPEFWGGNYNSNYFLDEDLIRITEEMYYTEPGNKEAYDARNCRW